MSLALVSFQVLTTKRERFDCHVASFCVQVRSFPLPRKRVDELPSHDGLSVIVEQDDGSVLAVRDTVADRFDPLMKLFRDRDAALQRNVANLCAARQLSDGRRLAPLAVFDDVDFQSEAGALGKPGVRDSIDLDEKVEVLERVVARWICHVHCTSWSVGEDTQLSSR